eukprot:8034039-Pyramimonas_sp.AAC.1
MRAPSTAPNNSSAAPKICAALEQPTSERIRLRAPDRAPRTRQSKTKQLWTEDGRDQNCDHPHPWPPRFCQAQRKRN